MSQSTIVNLEDLIPSTHIYRKFRELWDLDFVRSELSNLERHKLYTGYGLFRFFLCSLLQYMEDLGYRQLEKMLAHIFHSFSNSNSSKPLFSRALRSLNLKNCEIYGLEVLLVGR